VAVSIRKPGERKAKGYAWGLPTGNNCTLQQAKAALSEVWYDDRWDLLGQFMKFDVDVAVKHMGMKMPEWDRIHDTAYLLALNEPHEELGLKPSAERLLGLVPEERDVVVDWLKDNRPNIRESRESGKQKEKWEAYISEVPGQIVIPYMNGDVDRTVALYSYLYPIIDDRGMLDAYNRECRLMPILLENEQQGIHVDVPLLEHDALLYTNALDAADNWLRKKLRSLDLNFDSNEEVADALERCNMVNPGDWKYTKPSKAHPGGQRSVSKENLTPDMIRDPKVSSMFAYRNKVTTCLKTFMLPWLRQAVRTGGTVHTDWSQVRNTDRGSGATTFRMSSSPNFQNIPTSLEGRDGLNMGLLKKIISWLPDLPAMRKYFIPDKGGMWGKADYSQQELRLLDHFADGSIGYKQNPKLDVHEIVTNAVHAAGLFTDTPFKELRNAVKRHVVFKKIYGGGEPAICNGLGCTRPVAAKIIAAMVDALPGYKKVDDACKAAGSAGECIVTWGGRQYFVEPARFVAAFGRVADFSYKLTNYLIQGSAADVTKEAIIRYHEHPKREARFLLSVHDELDVSAPAKRVKQELTILKACMESIEIDPPMVAEPAFGPRWSELQEVR
jgi:DNA polymerase I-like protein with 3'-5' exonuclease and polymerase domains